jgi:hypothetical protein
MPALRRKFLSLSTAAILFALLLPVAARAQTALEAASELARRIVVSTGPRRAITLKVRNLSTLKAADVSAVLGALENELQSHGIRLGEEASVEAEVLVTISENVRGFLLVAQIRKGSAPGEETVAIVPFVRAGGSAAPAQPEMVRLEHTLMLEQEAPILDFAAVKTGTDAVNPWLLVLQPDKVALLEKSGTGWEERHSVSIAAPQPWPRDLRGRLLVEAEAFWAYLPGLVCGGAVEGASPPSITMDCQPSDDPWPLYSGGQLLGYAHFSARRNYFDGKLELANGRAREFAPFFSGAAVETDSNSWWILAGTDGQARLYGRAVEPEAIFLGWGSDVASVKSGCDSGWQILATAAGDAGSPDSLRAFEIAGAEAREVSAPLRLPGAVTALWAASESAAIVVTRNLNTGRYEAHTLTIVCGR